MPLEGNPSGMVPLRRRLQQEDHRFIESLDTKFWTNICSMEVTSDECLSEVESLLSCPFKIAAARSFRGHVAQMINDFLDRVSGPYALVFTDSCCRAQVLERSTLDDKLRRRCLRLLSKICQARKIIPASYVLQQKLIHSGNVCCHGGYGDVSNGEYLRRPVAIKRLKGDPERIFKVTPTNLAYLQC